MFRLTIRSSHVSPTVIPRSHMPRHPMSTLSHPMIPHRGASCPYGETSHVRPLSSHDLTLWTHPHTPGGIGMPSMSDLPYMPDPRSPGQTSETHADGLTGPYPLSVYPLAVSDAPRAVSEALRAIWASRAGARERVRVGGIGAGAGPSTDRHGNGSRRHRGAGRFRPDA
jgi:hypothetical protein